MTIASSPNVSKEEMHDILSTTNWYHRIEIFPGVITSGRCPPSGSYNLGGMLQFIESCSGGLHGKRILEIGTWDGPIAYMLRGLGHDITATDIQNPAKTGFESLGKLTGLNVHYHRCSVYELPIHFEREFDIVLFFGVFYHLKHPVLAFEKIAQVLKANGIVIVTGSGVGNYFEDLDGNTTSTHFNARFAKVLADMDDANIPVCLSYPGTFLKGDNWFLPNASALKAWMRAAGFVEGTIHCQVGSNGILNLSGFGTLLNSAVIEHPTVGEEGGYKIRL
jgi:SAM-dependent methyltransferase